MFGGDLPVMHQSRKWKRKMRGRPFTQRFCGCKQKEYNSWAYAITERNTERSATAEEKTVHFMNIVASEKVLNRILSF
ncbi:hypothetical protein A3844_23945 [Paenibacillus helianthi]|uniref:Uncharacterized protein n=1 Tax=Paenibacillus helianthi TaxID=1349432 RepID=A0ABX3EHE2_9BACL|nr:hypothetical protein A3842_21820 [Paenibacillus sp. P3E]OKP82468.1 hypothetical protein A3844_23945 [Paenibacillus helianthi]OKP90788.1 hypothetical protein A3848_11035 [Paenibacillus sp. P32E]